MLSRKAIISKIRITIFCQKVSERKRMLSNRSNLLNRLISNKVNLDKFKGTKNRHKLEIIMLSNLQKKRKN